MPQYGSIYQYKQVMYHDKKQHVPVFPNPAFHINFDDFSCRPAAGRQYSDSLTPKNNQHRDLVAKKKNLNKQR